MSMKQFLNLLISVSLYYLTPIHHHLVPQILCKSTKLYLFINLCSTSLLFVQNSKAVDQIMLISSLSGFQLLLRFSLKFCILVALFFSVSLPSIPWDSLSLLFPRLQSFWTSSSFPNIPQYYKYMSFICYSFYLKYVCWLTFISLLCPLSAKFLVVLHIIKILTSIKLDSLGNKPLNSI